MTKKHVVQSKEESDAHVYYDLKVDHINTRAEIAFDETGQNARRAWMGRFYADRERLDLLELDKWCEDNPYAQVVLAVEDNGADGDGVWLRAVLEDTGPKFTDKDGGALFGISLTPRQARVLAKALMSAVRLREAE